MPTILAVDDSATMRRALEITFAATEFDLEACGTPEEALEKVKTAQPALVIVDVSLPPSDGYELCTTIKVASPALPVLMLASKQNPFDPTKGAQADGNINKPFDSQILADKVREMVAGGAAKPAAAAVAPAARPAAARPPAVAAAAAPTPAAATPAKPAARPGAALKETKPLGLGLGQTSARPAARPAAKPAVPVARPAARPAAKPVARPPAAGTVPGMPAGAGTPSPTASVQPKPAGKSGTGASWPAPAPKGSTPDAAVPRQPAVPGGVAGAAAGADMPAKLAGLGLSADQVAGVMALSREVIEQVVWEVVPTLAESLIKEEIARLTR